MNTLLTLGETLATIAAAAMLGLILIGCIGIATGIAVEQIRKGARCGQDH